MWKSQNTEEGLQTGGYHGDMQITGTVRFSIRSWDSKRAKVKKSTWWSMKKYYNLINKNNEMIAIILLTGLWLYKMLTLREFKWRSMETLYTSLTKFCHFKNYLKTKS